MFGLLEQIAIVRKPSGYTKVGKYAVNYLFHLFIYEFPGLLTWGLLLLILWENCLYKLSICNIYQAKMVWSSNWPNSKSLSVRKLLY